jgi:hypothetical protein
MKSKPITLFIWLSINAEWIWVCVPGASSGLQLTLNLEQYENVEGQSSDEGIKVIIPLPD